MTRALCFAAHPDDLETYLGSTLILLARAGVDLRFVLATDGERGTRQPEGRTRIDEQLDSLAWFARSLGVAEPCLERWCLPDAELGAHRDELAYECARSIDRWGGDLVFGPVAGDPHLDHAALGDALARVRSSVWHWLPAEPDRASHAIAATSEDFDLKVAWIERHASQIPGAGESRAYLPAGRDIVQRIRVRDARWGRFVDAAFAEPLLRSDCQPSAAAGGEPVVLRGLEDFF